MGDAKYKQSHKEQGLCLFCSEKAIPGLTLCKKHSLNKIRQETERYHQNPLPQRERSQLMRLRREQEGKCKKCGKPLTEDEKDKKQCVNCGLGIHRTKGLPLYQGDLYEDTPS